MNHQSPTVINHPARIQQVLLRGDYITICQDFVDEAGRGLPESGVACCAYLLGQIDYLTYINLQYRDKARKINNAARMEGADAGQVEDLWVWITNGELAKKSLGLFSERTVRTYMPYIIAAGYVTTRRNPKYKFDQCPQYLLQWRFIQSCVDIATDSANLRNGGGNIAESNQQEGNNDSANLPNGNGDSAVAILKETQEETPELTLEILPASPTQGRSGKLLTQIQCLIERIGEIRGGTINFGKEAAAAKKIFDLDVYPKPVINEIIPCYQHWYNRREVDRYGSSLHSFLDSFPPLLARLREGKPLEGNPNTGRSQSASGENGLQDKFRATQERIRRKEEKQANP